MDKNELIRIISAKKEELKPKLAAYEDLTKKAVDDKGQPRAFTAEEFQLHERIGLEINQCNSEILGAKSALKATELVDAADEKTASDFGLSGPSKLPHASDEYRENFYNFMAGGAKNGAPLWEMTRGHDIQNITGTSPSTGSVLVPRELERAIRQEAARLSPLLGISSVRTIATRASQIPFLADLGVLAPRAEAESYVLTDPVMSGKNLDIFNFGGLFPVSMELLEDASELEAAFARLWGRAVADTVEEYGLKGAGGQTAFKNLAGADVTLTISGKVPPGILTLADTIVAVVAAGAHNAITSDDIIKLAQGVKASARMNGTYFLGGDFETRALLLKDSTNRPLWMPSLVAGQPATLNGKPYVVSDRIANVGASAVSALFGDFSDHDIAIRRGITIGTSDHFYFGNNMRAVKGDIRMGAGVARNLSIGKLVHPAAP